MKTFADIDRSPDPRTLASFRWIVLAGAAIVGLLLRFAAHHSAPALAVWAIGAAVVLLSLVPGLGRPLYIGWMFLGVAIGLVTSPIVLGLAWVIIFVPAGLAMRLVGHDPMKRRYNSGGGSYWEDHPPAGKPRRYFRQF